MRTPWYCPYCGLPSNRRWNVSAHIRRKHPGLYNPLPEFKQNPPFSTYFSQPQNQSSNPPFSTYFSQPQNQSSNSNTPRDDSLDPVQIFENSIKFQNILQEIKQWDKMKLALLLSEIFKLHNFYH
jgi:hypothetical protein